MNRKQLDELLYQSLENERGGIKIYETALRCVQDEHLYHTSGWALELWIDALGMPAVLPPPEEEKEVKTAIGASRAKQARKKML